MRQSKDPIRYREAHEVAEIARDLIYDFHPHLGSARIRYIFRNEIAEDPGKLVYGKARKIGGLNAWLATEDRGYEEEEPEPFFVIEIAEPIWKI
jgi:putative metallopeptidase